MVLHLGAIVAVIDDEAAHQVRAVQQAMLRLDIVEFDREAVDGGTEFGFGEQERRGIALVAPPAKDGLGGGKFHRRNRRQHAQDVQVGVVNVEFAGSR